MNSDSQRYHIGCKEQKAQQIVPALLTAYGGVMSTMKLLNLLCIILFMFYSSYPFACGAPAKGSNLSHADLVEKTDNIIFAVALTDSRRRSAEFEVIKKLKGDSEEKFIWGFSTRPSEHISTDFAAHNEPAFWSETWLARAPKFRLVQRSQFHGGACIPSFTFVKGEQYLLFVDSPGHPHSAEIIKRNDDKWLLYVTNTAKLITSP